MAQYLVTGIKGGGSSALRTIVNAIDYNDAEAFAVNLGWEDVACMRSWEEVACMRSYATAQYDTPAYRLETNR